MLTEDMIEKVRRAYREAELFGGNESHCWEAAIRTLAPMVLDMAARIPQRRMEERFAEHGTREWDTNATYYSGSAGELYESLDEEDDEIGVAILALKETFNEPR